MNRTPLLPWVLLTVWATWIFALQGWVGRFSSLSPWVPDVGLVLLLSLSVRLPREDLPMLAVSLALARIALSIDPPVAVLAGTMGAVAIVRAIRSVLESTSPLMMFLLAFWMLLGWVAWFSQVHEVRTVAGLTPTGVLESGFIELNPRNGLRMAFTTGLVALFCGKLLAHLPGMTPLLKRRLWQVAGSSH